jgi:hypothetical protein
MTVRMYQPSSLTWLRDIARFLYHTRSRLLASTLSHIWKFNLMTQLNFHVELPLGDKTKGWMTSYFVKFRIFFIPNSSHLSAINLKKKIRCQRRPYLEVQPNESSKLSCAVTTRRQNKSICIFVILNSSHSPPIPQEQENLTPEAAIFASST